MHRFSSRLVGSSFLAIAMSILVVGVVWASSGALQTSNNSSTVSSSTVPGGNEDDELGDGDLPGIGPGDEIDELRRLVVDLADQVETLTETISTMQSDISSAESVAREAATAAGKVKSIADGAAADAEEAQRVANDVASRFGSIELRTSKLNDEGVYTGAINPNQLSRRLSPTDMTGDWPLDRVTGDLDTRRLLMQFTSSCSDRFGFHTVLISDAFRRISCARIPSQ